MAANLDHAGLEALRQHVENTPGRIASTMALMSGLATLVGDIRSSDDVAALAKALGDSGAAFAQAVEAMPAAVARLPSDETPHERVNHMGWPMAGTRDAMPAVQYRPGTVVVERAPVFAGEDEDRNATVRVADE